MCGDDRLKGGFGDDELWGDIAEIDDGGSISAGNDTFVFILGGGNDTVGDFNDGPTGAQDLIHLSFYRGLNGFADLSGFITQSGADTVIDLGLATGQGAGLDTIRLLNTTAGDFGADDFRSSRRQRASLPPFGQGFDPDVPRAYIRFTKGSPDRGLRGHRRERRGMATLRT